MKDLIAWYTKPRAYAACERDEEFPAAIPVRRGGLMPTTTARTQPFSCHAGNLLFASHTRLSARGTDACRWGHGAYRWLLRRGLPAWRLTDVLWRRCGHERNEVRGSRPCFAPFPKRACASSSAMRWLRTRTVSSTATRRFNAQSPMSHAAWMPSEWKAWRKEEEHGEFLTRLAAVYFIWDPGSP